MNGLFNMNFMMTFLLAKDLPETRDKLLMAMTAGQSANLMAPVLLKVGAIDSITNLTQENKNLKTEISAQEEASATCKAALAKCQADLATCQAALATCQDGSELKRCQDELNACKAKLTECDKILPKCADIKGIMGRVKDLKTFEKLKAEDETLKTILALALEIS